MFNDITLQTVFALLLVFARIGSAIMLMPGIGDSYMSPRSRLIIALGLTVIIMPVIQNILPPIPASTINLLMLMGSEIIIGVFIGMVARIVISTMHISGMIISYQCGLSSANLFDPTQGTQGTIIGTFLNLMAILLIFISNLHHIFIHGIADSYQLFTINDTLPLAGFADVITKTIAESFMTAFKIAAPQVVVGLMLSLCAGIMGRLMPQMQVFFVIMPIQILLGFFILMITLSVSMMWFIDYYSETIGQFLVKK